MPGNLTLLYPPSQRRDNSAFGKASDAGKDLARQEGAAS
jgi:hypothetical protein